MAPVDGYELSEDARPDFFQEANHELTWLCGRRSSSYENDPCRRGNNSLENKVTEVAVESDDYATGCCRPLNDFDIAGARTHLNNRQHIMASQAQQCHSCGRDVLIGQEASQLRSALKVMCFSSPTISAAYANTAAKSSGDNWG